MTDLSPLPAARHRVALLVDGDNLSHSHAGALILAASRHGTLTIKRVYGNMATHPGWDEAPGFRSVHSGRGKNAADLALVVEAMALMLTGQADVLALASSDGDFSHLALHLVEKGMKVVGMGEAKAPAHFRKSCNSFQELGTAQPAKSQKSSSPKPTTEGATLPPPVAKLNPSSPADAALLGQIASQLRGEPQGLTIALLSTRMSRGNAFQISLTPFKTWRNLLSQHPDRFQCDPPGPEARVRLIS